LHKYGVWFASWVHVMASTVQLCVSCDGKHCPTLCIIQFIFERLFPVSLL